jgi:hypothetical protein
MFILSNRRRVNHWRATLRRRQGVRGGKQMFLTFPHHLSRSMPFHDAAVEMFGMSVAKFK